MAGETVTIVVKASGTEQAAAAIESIADSNQKLVGAMQDVEKASHDAAKAMGATNQQASALSKGVDAGVKAFKIFTAASIAAGFASGKFQKNLVGLVDAIQYDLTLALRWLDKAFANMGWERGHRGTQLLLGGIDAVFSRIRAVARFIQTTWAAAMKAMLTSTNPVVRSIATLFEGLTRSIRMSFAELGGRILPRLTQPLRELANRTLYRIMAPFEALRARVRGVGESFGRARAKVAEFTRGVRGMFLLLGTLIGAGIFVAMARGITRFAAAGAALVPVQNAFQKLAVNAKTTADILLKDLQFATRNTVASIDLMKSAVLALNSGAIKSRGHLTELARASQVLGQTVGIDTAEAFQNLIRGIGLVNPQLIKSVGVLVSAEDAYRSYANRIGVSIAQLDDHQKKEAFRIEVMDKVREATNRVADESQQLTVELQRLSAATQNFANTARSAAARSEGLAESVRLWADVMVGLALIMEGEGGDAITFMVDQFSELGWIIAGLTPVLNFFIARGKALGEEQRRIDALTGAWREMGEAMQTIREGEVGLVTRADLQNLAIARAEVGRLAEALAEDPKNEQLLKELDGAVRRLQAVRGHLEDIATEAPEAVDPFADIPAILQPGIDSIERFRQGVQQAEDAIAEASIQAHILRRRHEEATDDELKQKLIQQWEETQQSIEESNAALVLYRRLLDEAITIGTQQAGILDSQLQGALDLLDVHVEMNDIMRDYRLNLEGFPALWGDVESAVARANEARQNMEALGQMMGPGESPFAGPDLLGFLEASRQAGIGPTEAGFTAEGDLLGPALMELAKLQEIETQWTEVLHGNRAALEDLVLAGHLTEDQADQLARAFEEVGRASVSASQQMVTTLGGAIQAMILGTERLGSVMVSTATQLLQAASGGGLTGTIIGAVGGIVGALFRRSEEKQRVTVDDYGLDAIRQQERIAARQNQGPNNLTIQWIDPSSGEVVKQTQAQIRRQERRDAIQRLPTGGVGL